MRIAFGRHGPIRDDFGHHGARGAQLFRQRFARDVGLGEENRVPFSGPAVLIASTTAAGASSGMRSTRARSREPLSRAGGPIAHNRTPGSARTSGAASIASMNADAPFALVNTIQS